MYEIKQIALNVIRQNYQVYEYFYIFLVLEPEFNVKFLIVNVKLTYY